MNSNSNSNPDSRRRGAASLGEPLEATNFPTCDDSIWRQVTFPHTFDFTKIAYRVAEQRQNTGQHHESRTSN